MDVLLIHPPYERLMGLKVEYFPMGLGYVAGVLRNNGYNVGIYNSELGPGKREYKYSPRGRIESFNNYKRNLYDDNHPVWNEIREIIRRKKAKIIGISSYCSTHSAVRRVAKIAKAHPDCHVVVGGPYATLQPEKIILDRHIDFVVSGEGEYSMLELTDCLLKKKGDIGNIDGITFRVGSKSRSTCKRSRIRNLDALPFIDYGLLLNKEFYDCSKMMSLIGSRGCPYRCTFCASVPLWGKKVVFRSVDSLLNELDFNIKEYGITRFRFYDDTFTSSPDRTVEFCTKFVQRKFHNKLRWGCLSRVNGVNEKVIRALEEANCSSIALGVESGSDRILECLKKGITKNMVREKTNIIKQSKLLLHLYFMIGSPHEKECDIIESYRFIKELKPDSINLTTFTPYFGTALYDYCYSSGILPENNVVSMYEEIGHHNKYNYFCPEIQRERFIELVDMMMELADQVCNKWNKKKILSLIRNDRYSIVNPIKICKALNHKIRNN